MQNILYQVLHPWHWLTYGQNASGVAAVAAIVAAGAAVLGLVGLYFYTRYTRSMMLLQQETQRATITPILVSSGPIEFTPAEFTNSTAAQIGLIPPEATAYRPVLTVRNVGQGPAIYITSWVQPVTNKFEMGGSVIFLQSSETNSGDDPLAELVQGESKVIKFGLMNPSAVHGRVLFVIQCRDAANGLHQLQLLYSDWPEGSVQMTMVHGPLKPLTLNRGAEHAPSRGLGGWLTTHRRPMILLGAAVTLAGYFAKDVVKERIKDHLATISVGAAEYRTNLSLVQLQTAELASTSPAIEADSSSLPRDKILVSLANLTYRQELNTNELFAFGRSVPDVPTSNLVEIRQLVDATDEITKSEQAFADHPPSDAPAFQTSARLLLHRLTELSNQTGKAGADLEVLSLEESERLEHQSSFYGWGITLLYLCGLALTIVSGLYGVEVSKTE